MQHLPIYGYLQCSKDPQDGLKLVCPKGVFLTQLSQSNVEKSPQWPKQTSPRQKSFCQHIPPCNQPCPMQPPPFQYVASSTASKQRRISCRQRHFSSCKPSNYKQRPPLQRMQPPPVQFVLSPPQFMLPPPLQFVQPPPFQFVLPRSQFVQPPPFQFMLPPSQFVHPPPVQFVQPPPFQFVQPPPLQCMQPSFQFMQPPPSKCVHPLAASTAQFAINASPHPHYCKNASPR